MKKEDLEKINAIGDFLHEAFCVDGETKFIKLVDEPINGVRSYGSMYRIEDSKRGEFYVTIQRTA